MGCVSSKCQEENAKLRERIYILEEEIREMRCKNEQESRAYEHCAALLATKEAAWRKEWKRCTEEIMTLRRRMEEEEARRKAAEAVALEAASKEESGWQKQLSACYLVEQMRAEQARREEAAEKWKRLYHAIKTELDDLIQRTHRGEMLFCGNEEVIEGLQKELKLKEETTESLRSRLAAVEQEGSKREREIDILRQSLRILSNAKRNGIK